MSEGLCPFCFMANGHKMLHKRGRDFWWYRHEANWSLILRKIMKIPFCLCLTRQQRDLGWELGWNLVRFKNTACSDRHLGFGTYFAWLCVSPALSRRPREHLWKTIPAGSSGPGKVPVAQQHSRDTAACAVTARVHWYTSAWQLLWFIAGAVMALCEA